MSTVTYLWHVDEFASFLRDGDGSSSRLDKLIKIRKEKTKSDVEKHAGRVNICKDIIREENRGATHFISSVDLGAKICITSKVVITETKSTFSVKAGVRALSHLAFKEENISAAAKYQSRISATIDPRVKMEGARTVVSEECERLIGYEVSPVWLLVSESDWRSAMKEALPLYVKEQLASLPSVIASGNYLCFLEWQRLQNTILLNVFAKDSWQCRCYFLFFFLN